MQGQAHQARGFALAHEGATAQQTLGLGNLPLKPQDVGVQGQPPFRMDFASLPGRAHLQKISRLMRGQKGPGDQQRAFLVAENAFRSAPIDRRDAGDVTTAHQGLQLQLAPRETNILARLLVDDGERIQGLALAQEFSRLKKSALLHLGHHPGAPDPGADNAADEQGSGQCGQEEELFHANSNVSELEFRRE